MNESELRQWVESELRGSISAFDRVGSGASRATWLVSIGREDGSSVEVVLRADSGDGPMSGTDLDLTREAVVYRALRGTDVRVPRLLSSHEDGTALLIERAAGTDAFAAAAEPTQRAIAIDYMTCLADLHRVDVDHLELPGFDRPAVPNDCAKLDVALWRKIYDTRSPDSDSLVEFACDWLHANAPIDAERISLCHGDAGPGNFLFEGDRVSALLDWEFAHLGDPLDDLAWIFVRAQLLGGFGDASDNLACWESKTGLRAAAERIEYYRALVLVRMAISCRAALAHAGTRTMDTTVYDMLIPYLHYLLPQAMHRAGCSAPELDGFERDGEAGIERSPILSQHARPLDPLPHEPLEES